MIDVIYPCGCRYDIHFGYDDGYEEDNKNWVESDGESFEMCAQHNLYCESKYKDEKIILGK